MRNGLLALVVLALSSLWGGVAGAEPGSGPREDIDQSFTTTRPGTPTGVDFSARYHAAGDPNGAPPFLKRMVFYPPRGMRFDTRAPESCTASDAELALRGPDACPPRSRLGGGKVEGLLYQPITDILIHEYKHDVDVMNNFNEQILLVKSEGYTVVRGKVRSDSSIEFKPTTCFPASPTGECVDDNVRQLMSSTSMPRYTRKASSGRTRSYATTPPRCPARGYWQSKVGFWWSDGSVDRVAINQPCASR